MRQTLLPLQQTPEERRAALAERARSLAAARAAAAAAAAAAAQERRFAAGCDELRQAQCGARAREVAAQQLVQVRACGRAARALVKHAPAAPDHVADKLPTEALVRPSRPLFRMLCLLAANSSVSMQWTYRQASTHGTVCMFLLRSPHVLMCPVWHAQMNEKRREHHAAREAERRAAVHEEAEHQAAERACEHQLCC